MILRTSRRNLKSNNLINYIRFSCCEVKSFGFGSEFTSAGVVPKLFLIDVRGLEMLRLMEGVGCGEESEDERVASSAFKKSCWG
ncbi:hypothetical protein HOD08_01880 [bacterium]|nr:hypothetical protein [bacterium]